MISVTITIITIRTLIIITTIAIIIIIITIFGDANLEAAAKPEAAVDTLLLLTATYYY